MNESPTEQIMQVLRSEYEALDSLGEIEIQPALIAARAVERLDPTTASPTLMGWCATLELRQLARGICRRVSSVDDPDDETQGCLFDGQLQRRYPAMRGGEERYVLREHLTIDERRSNSARLRSEAAAKNRHADALDAETEGLIAAGLLSKDDQAA